MLSNGNEKESSLLDTASAPNLLDTALKEAGLDFDSPSTSSNFISPSMFIEKSQDQSSPQRTRVVRMTNGQLKAVLANGPRATLIPSRTLSRPATTVLPFQPSNVVRLTGSPTPPGAAASNVRIVTVTRPTLNATISKSSPTEATASQSSISTAASNIITISSSKVQMPTPNLSSAEPTMSQPDLSSESTALLANAQSSSSTIPPSRPLTGAKACSCQLIYFLNTNLIIY